jgi:hypothetical protein
MDKQILYTDFRNLRRSYREVRSFLESETSEKDISLKSRIVKDLGCAGDDNWELLTKFVTKYNLKAEGFVYSDHFLSEGELFGSSAALWNLICIPVVIVLYLIKLVSLGRLDGTHTKLFSFWQRDSRDMTFGDILTWYIVGKYCLRTNIYIRLKNAV